MTGPVRNRGGKTKRRRHISKDWVTVLFGRARSQPHTVDKVLDAVNGAEVAAALADVVKPEETVLCPDGHTAFLHLQQAFGVQTKSI